MKNSFLPQSRFLLLFLTKGRRLKHIQRHPCGENVSESVVYVHFLVVALRSPWKKKSLSIGRSKAVSVSAQQGTDGHSRVSLFVCFVFWVCFVVVVVVLLLLFLFCFCPTWWWWFTRLSSSAVPRQGVCFRVSGSPRVTNSVPTPAPSVAAATACPCALQRTASHHPAWTSCRIPTSAAPPVLTVGSWFYLSLQMFLPVLTDVLTCP